ncbi:type II toxin-antitoxin system VapB family antitoxin [Marinibaculum pumilum]|uniref:Type II toxin-antitoxin system VapB family antitoxin n=1 Tax=Marinibaculum pumilum TaxID=1766165 RepID=A0ABV7KZR0_9PROT
MPLNIKDEEVHRQARELAELTGKSITAAVREAIEEKLAAARAGAEPRRPNADALLAIARRCSARLKARGLTSDHSDLYDDQGLPR